MPEPTITLEVCVDSLSSAITAGQCGAQRIELNSALELGGLTPPIGLTHACIAALQPMRCQVIAMVRPRIGGFAYNSEERFVMRQEIEHLLAAGVHGIALGVLDSRANINVQANHELIRAVLDAGKTAVFHRAFDLTPDPIQAMEQLIDLGFTRILTSGQAPTAREGAALLCQLQSRTDGRIEILPAGGITPANVRSLLQQTGCNQAHASLRMTVDEPHCKLQTNIRFDSPAPPHFGHQQADARLISEMIRALR